MVSGCVTRGLTKAQEREVKGLGGDPDRTFLFTLSDGRRDREGDRIEPSGWDLRNFDANPIIPWQHDYDRLPVAKSLKAWVSNSTDKGMQLKAYKQFIR